MIFGMNLENLVIIQANLILIKQSQIIIFHK